MKKRDRRLIVDKRNLSKVDSEDDDYNNIKIPSFEEALQSTGILKTKEIKKLKK